MGPSPPSAPPAKYSASPAHPTWVHDRCQGSGVAALAGMHTHEFIHRWAAKLILQQTLVNNVDQLPAVPLVHGWVLSLTMLGER